MSASLEHLLRNTKLLRQAYNAAPAPLRALLLNIRARPLVRLRYGKDAYRKLEELLQRDRWNSVQLEEYVQAARQRWSLLAFQAPYYRDLIQQASSTTDFPVLTREEVRQAPQRLRVSVPGAIRVFTSGTSGSGLPVWWDPGAYAWNWAYEMKHKAWAGVGPREWRVTFFGSQVIPLAQQHPPFWMTNHPEHQVMVSIFHLSEKTAGSYVEFLEKQQGRILEGFPTVLLQAARYVRAFRGKLQFKAVFSTGEPLLPFIRNEIEQAFQAKIYDHYGMTELAGLILECGLGGYHALLDYGDLEILDEDGKALPPGEEGYLVWTGFLNPAMPFIRYRIGDRGIWEDRRCACGLPYPLVRPTLTRDSDYLMTPSGTLYSPRAINQVLKDKVSFQSCQFLQTSLDEVIIRVVPTPGIDVRPELLEVEKALRQMLGKNVEIGEEIATEPLRRGNQGKIPLIVSRLHPFCEAGKRDG